MKSLVCDGKKRAVMASATRHCACNAGGATLSHLLPFLLPSAIPPSSFPAPRRSHGRVRDLSCAPRAVAFLNNRFLTHQAELCATDTFLRTDTARPAESNFFFPSFFPGRQVARWRSGEEILVRRQVVCMLGWIRYPVEGHTTVCGR